MLLAALPASAETIRIATYNTELARKGPGLLLRDIKRGADPQISAVVAEIAAVKPDVIALQGFDYDLENRALHAFAQALNTAGVAYPHLFAGPPNAGRQTEIDLDGDGRLNGPGDAQGFGRFFGQGSMAVLSRFPINDAEVRDLSDLLWKDMPDALLPEVDGKPFPSAAAQAIQRLSAHGHRVLPITHPTLGRFSLLTYHAAPPVFDGPEDRNGMRNHDETMLWFHLLHGRLGGLPDVPFVLAGDANLDPKGGDGRGHAMRRLLAHERISDPVGSAPTVVWDQTGPLRVDYVLPSRDWRVVGWGVRPINSDASRHALVWVDLTR